MELRRCIQDPSHIFIGLGPCLSMGWKVRNPEMLLELGGREVLPTHERGARQEVEAPYIKLGLICQHQDLTQL